LNDDIHEWLLLIIFKVVFKENFVVNVVYSAACERTEERQLCMKIED